MSFIDKKKQYIEPTSCNCILKAEEKTLEKLLKSLVNSVITLLR